MATPSSMGATPTTVHAARGLGVLDIIALALVIIGGLNWGLVGLFSFDLVAAIFGAGSTLSRIVYVLVGLGAVWTLILTFRLGRGGRV